MTNLNDVVANERIADLDREATAERRGRLARAATPNRNAPRHHRQRQGSLARALSNHDMPLEEIRGGQPGEGPGRRGRLHRLHRERLAEKLAQRVRELEATLFSVAKPFVRRHWDCNRRGLSGGSRGQESPS
jgi:hypothetical protein